MIKQRTANIVLAIGGLNGFVSTEVQNSACVLRISVSAENPAHRQYVNRCAPCRWTNMIKRILVNGLLTTLVQIIFYIIVLFLCVTFDSLLFNSKSLSNRVTDIGYPLTISVLFLGTMLLTANLISSLFNKQIMTLGLLTVVATIYFIGWIEDFSHWPWATTLFISVGLVTIYLKLFVDKKLKGLVGS